MESGSFSVFTASFMSTRLVLHIAANWIGGPLSGVLVFYQRFGFPGATWVTGKAFSGSFW